MVLEVNEKMESRILDRYQLIILKHFSPWHARPFDGVVGSIIIDLIVAFLPSFSNILLVRVSPLDSLFVNFLLLPSSFLSSFKLVFKVSQWFLGQFSFQCCLWNRTGQQGFALNYFKRLTLMTENLPFEHSFLLDLQP